MMEGRGIINGHEYVDLGLPSGTLWATCNVGTDNPEEKGMLEDSSDKDNVFDS